MPLRVGVHPVLEAIKAGQPLERVVIAKGAGGPRIQEIIDLCRRHSIPVRFEERRSVDRLAAGAVHQGIVALGAAQKYRTLDQMPPPDPNRPLVLLDGVEDPHNLGAVVRSAHAAGAAAVVIPERRAAGLTETVGKAAAGALEHLPVVRVVNLTRTLEDLKQQGYWIYGLDERGTRAYFDVEYAAPTAFVFGGEGKGLHDQVRKHCDEVIRIPMAGAISSLNVSVAAGIVLFDWKRRLDPRP